MAHGLRPGGSLNAFVESLAGILKIEFPELGTVRSLDTGGGAEQSTVSSKLAPLSLGLGLVALAFFVPPILDQIGMHIPMLGTLWKLAEIGAIAAGILAFKQAPKTTRLAAAGVGVGELTLLADLAGMHRTLLKMWFEKYGSTPERSPSAGSG